jgi:pyruvate/2-oxoglutarate dehydrogenase complex dihydrolipoamide dehydrogenase (E3) component
VTKQFDAIVIGTGQSGPPLAGRLSREGLKTAIIERKLIGGTCVNVGCIPTKTLVGSAKVAYSARRAQEFGVVVDGSIAVDMEQVKKRKDLITSASNKGVTAWIDGMEGVTLVHGHTRFVGPKQVQVNGETLVADKIFIDTGARARVPDIAGLDEVDYLTNSSMMEVDFLPEHLIIIGGSYIGLEFAQMYRRFGAEVTVVEMSNRLIPREDEDVSDAVREILEGEGVNIRLNAECIEVGRSSDGITVGVSCNEEPKQVKGTHLLLAVGRVPNTDDLGLDAAGIKSDERGHIVVDDSLRTNMLGVWAVGEVNGRGAFTHTSYNDYEIVAANLFDDDPRRITDRILCYGLFIDPPLGRVGITEREARVSGRNVLIGKRMMTRVGRAREFGETRGFMKVLVDADSEEILGAVILGLNGDEVIHCIVDVMYAKKPYTTISRAVHIHPTVAELIPTVLQELQPLSNPDAK